MDPHTYLHTRISWNSMELCEIPRGYVIQKPTVAWLRKVDQNVSIYLDESCTYQMCRYTLHLNFLFFLVTDIYVCLFENIFYLFLWYC